MAKFCKYCGSPLEDGKPCTCPEAMQAAGVAPTAPTAPTAPVAPSPYATDATAQKSKAADAITAGAKNFLPFLKMYFRQPTAALKNAIAAKDIMVGVFSAIVFLVSMVICALCSGGKVSSVSHGFVVPYGAFIVLGLIWFVFFVATPMLVSLASGKILNHRADAIGSFLVGSTTNIWFALFFLACGLFAFISLPLSVVLLFVGIIMRILVSVMSVIAAAGNPLKSTGALWAVVGIVFGMLVLAVFITGSAVGNALSDAVESAFDIFDYIL